jgi:hypothetical protein
MIDLFLSYHVGSNDLIPYWPKLGVTVSIEFIPIGYSRAHQREANVKPYII